MAIGSFSRLSFYAASLTSFTLPLQKDLAESFDLSQQRP